MPVIHQRHDKFFKLSMSELSVAQDFLKIHLPAILLQKIDFSTLRLEKNSFIDEAYKANEADVVYSVKLEGSIAYIYILCEQQTEIDQQMAFRLLVYTVRLIEAHHRQHPNDPLPLVYPMVVYSGEKPWDAPLEIFPLFGEKEALAREWLLQPYQLLDIQRISDEELQKHTWSGFVEFALKNRQIRDFAAFLKVLLPWVNQLQVRPQGMSLARIMLQYILDGIEANELEVFFEQVDQHLSTNLKGEAMTLAQCLEQRGLEKGLQQGRQEGRQEGEVAVLTRQIQRRFGIIPAPYAKRMVQANQQTLLQWSEKILEATTLDDIFN